MPANFYIILSKTEKCLSACPDSQKTENININRRMYREILKQWGCRKIANNVKGNTHCRAINVPVPDRYEHRAEHFSANFVETHRRSCTLYVYLALCRCSDNLEHLPRSVEHTKVGLVYKSMQIHRVPCFTVNPKYREEGYKRVTARLRFPRRDFSRSSHQHARNSVA